MGELPFDSFEIFPAINFARVGDSPQYFEGPSIPDLWVGGHDQEDGQNFAFRDENNLLKKQAARFRIYGYKDGKVVREITLHDKDVDVSIEWEVQVANKKNSHQLFQGKYKAAEKLNIRNATWPDRASLNATPPAQKVTDPKDGVKEFNTTVYTKDTQINLGSIKMLDSGSLVFIPSNGEAASIKNTLIFAYANNDYWYDTTSDGPVNATVKIGHKGSGASTELKSHQGRAWVVTAPPKFAPSVHTPVSLYDFISETQALPRFTYDAINKVYHDPIEFYEDIWPLLRIPSGLAWVNTAAWIGHGPGKSGDLVDAKYETILSDNSKKSEYFRQNVFQRIRTPKPLASDAEYNGQAFYYYMPQLSGDNGDETVADPSTWLTFTPVQFLKLKKWAAGEFTTGAKPALPPTSFSKIAPADQPAALNKAALEWCIGGPFYPGIELTFIINDPATFKDKTKPYRFADKFTPGDLTKWMACPWQADFYECETHWWPATRPDTSLLVDNYDEYIKATLSVENAHIIRTVNAGNITPGDHKRLFSDWDRGFRENEPTDFNPHWGNMDMVTNWNKMGFIVPVTTADPAAEVKTAQMVKGHATEQHVHCEMFRTLGTGANPNTADCDHHDLEVLLQTALMVELTTIPMYLYGMYSIKDNTREGGIARRVIRSVALEEMLHASLVANIMVAVGFSPSFYCREMVPFFPNTIPHFKKGALEVHLSPANAEMLEMCIDIEAPEHDENPGVATRTLLFAANAAHEFTKIINRATQLIKIQRGAPTQSRHAANFNFNSIADMYNIIMELLEKLSPTLQWDKNPGKQLDPGMGFAPKLAHAVDTENPGLVHISNLEDAKRAITQIVQQGEGAQKPANKSVAEFHEHSHYEKFKYVRDKLVGKYEIYPLIKNPSQADFEDSYLTPNLGLVSTAFNACYSYLMLLLETAWQIEDHEDKRLLIVGGMPSIMTGILASLADFLVKAPISSEYHAGPPFAFYKFTTGPQYAPKRELAKVVAAAANAFPQSDSLQTALMAANALPELSYPISFPNAHTGHMVDHILAREIAHG